MKRVNSLKSRESYKYIFLKGKRIRGQGNVIFVIRNSSLNKNNNESVSDIIRIGIAVGKKSGKANKRNWIKRRIRAVCSELITYMNNGFSIIVKPDPDNEKMSFEELKSDLVALFRRAGVLNENLESNNR